MDEKEGFSTTNVLRIYDTQIIERLNESYRAKRYESKNHFLNELVAIGLERKESFDIFQQKQEWKETLLGEGIRQLTERVTSLETYVQNQFRHFYALNVVDRAILSSLYHLCEATNAECSLSGQDLKSGFYDALPMRFDRIYEDALKRYDLL